MYERALGPDYARLDAAVQQFHRLQGQVSLRGTVTATPPETALASLLARCIHMPVKAQEGAIRFELDAAPLRERWTRVFPAHTLSSVLTSEGGFVQESLGAATLLFKLEEEHGALVMRLVSMRFLGVPCPRWLLPRIVAREHGTEGAIHFDVQAVVPGAGRVTRYEGSLELPWMGATT